MNNINSPGTQIKDLKVIYATIEQYSRALVINKNSSKGLKGADKEEHKLLANIINSLKRIKGVLVKDYGIKSIGVFGSYARSENKPGSDLDLIVDYEIKDFKEFYKMELFIKKELQIDEIDLLTFDGISPFALETLKDDVIYIN